MLPISRTTDVHPIPPGTLPSHTAGALQTQVVPLTPPTTGTGGVLALERAEVEALEEAQAIAATDGAHVITDSIPGDRPGIVAPCGDCAHAVVCSIKPALEADVALDLAAVGLPSGIRLSLISVDCDHFLRALPPLASRIAEAYAPPQDAREGVTAPEADDDVADDAPAAEPPAAPRWDAKESRSTAELEARDRRAAQVLAALERHGSDPEAVRKVAHEFGLRPNAVALIAKAARARQAVPA